MQSYIGISWWILGDVNLRCNTNGNLWHDSEYVIVEYIYLINILVKEEAGICIKLLVLSLDHHYNDYKKYIDSHNNRGKTGREVTRGL